MMSSTHRGKGMGWASLYHVFSESSSRLDTWDCLALHCTFHFCNFGKGNTKVLQHLLGSMWLYVLMVCFSLYL